jgi:ferritin-like protein
MLRGERSLDDTSHTCTNMIYRGGYANTSFTAKLQAQQTDMIVINKWEGMDERAFDIFLDRLGDLDVDTPQTKSDKGWISSCCSGSIPRWRELG